MRRATRTERFRYRFDTAMSRGLVAAVVLLATIAAVFLLVMVALVMVFRLWPQGTDSLNVVEAAWLTLMREMDSGNVGGDSGWGFRGAMLVVTIGGIFLTSALIGIINNAISGRIENLRKGRSRVIEEGHTLILGWSDQIFTVIKELATARAGGPRSVIVILADRDPASMEDDLHAHLAAIGRVSLVCRTGSPINQTDLEIVNVAGARSIIVLAPEAEHSDSQVIKTLLAIVNGPGRRPEPYRIVAEIQEPENAQVAALVGGHEVRVIVAAELISRIAVQTCRQSGLSTVYSELLSFDGNEVYFAEAPALAGLTFGEALHHVPTATLIGLCGPDGTSRLDPPMDTTIAPGDRIIAVAENQQAVRVARPQRGAVDESVIRVAQARPRLPERTLILGWNHRAPIIINVLDAYAARGSAVTLIADSAEAASVLADRCAAVVNLTLTVRTANTTDRRTLERMDLDTYRHVIVLGYSSAPGPQDADARTLVTLLHLRDLKEKRGYRFSLLGEMRDLRNRQLAEVTHADDFIVSDRLVSQMLAQVAEDWDLGRVFDELLDSHGAEFYLEPSSEYVAVRCPVTMHTVTAAASRRGEVAVGYRVRADADNPARSYGVRLNPPKGEAVTFADDDQIVVLASRTS